MTHRTVVVRPPFNIATSASTLVTELCFMSWQLKSKNSLIIFTPSSSSHNSTYTTIRFENEIRRLMNDEMTLKFIKS